MPNHVIKDGIWRSKRLGKLPWKLASLFPWIFLIADDWGRFEFRPYSIWSFVFGSRKDYSDDLPPLEDVSLALAEFSRVGLLIRYHIDGELAVWRKFEGRAMSLRRPSLYPNPVDFVGDILDDDVAWEAWRADPMSEIGQAYGNPIPSGAEQSRSDQSGVRPAKVKKAQKGKEPVTDAPELREYIDTYNRIFGTAIKAGGDNLRWAFRAKEHGYSSELAETIFAAVKDKTTKTARWCWDNNHSFEYLIRPPYLRKGELTPGPASLIPNELGMVKPRQAEHGSVAQERLKQIAAEKANG